jgi:hypothetical protein
VSVGEFAWLRVLLGLVGSLYLLMYGSMILLAGSAAQIQGESLTVVLMALAVVSGLSALAALVLAFIPVKRAARSGDYVGRN